MLQFLNNKNACSFMMSPTLHSSNQTPMFDYKAFIRFPAIFDFFTVTFLFEEC